MCQSNSAEAVEHCSLPRLQTNLQTCPTERSGVSEAQPRGVEGPLHPAWHATFRRGAGISVEALDRTHYEARRVTVNAEAGR